MPEHTEVRPFTQFLHEQRRGACHTDLSAALAEVAAAVVEHNKRGQITLTLKVEPMSDGMVQIIDDVVVKVPQGEKPASMFWVDENGNVQRSNPAQPELPLSAVRETPEAAARRIVGSEEEAV